MTKPENKNAHRRFLTHIKNGMPKGGDRIAAERASKLFLLAGSLLIILFLGESHPVFSNGALNLSYHAVAFLGTLLLWAALAFLLGGVMFNLIKKPPPWLVLGVLGIALLAASYARLQIDSQIKKHNGLSQPRVEHLLGGNVRWYSFGQNLPVAPQ